MDFLYQAPGEGWELWLVVGTVFPLAEGLTHACSFFGGVGALTTAMEWKRKSKEP